MSTPNAPGTEQWRVAQPTATMPTVHDGAGQARSDATRTTRTAVRTRPRRARLVLARVDPWSVMKLAFLLSIALAVVAVVAVFVLWSVLDSMGVFDSVSRAVEDLTRGGENQAGVDIYGYVGLERVLTVTLVLAAVNAVLMTALATLGAFLYNMAAALVGGLHVTFTEDV